MKRIFFLFTGLMPLCTTNSYSQTQAQMNQTAQADFQKSDAELNKTYKKLTKMLGAKEKQLLITAQKNWLKFRDSHCQFEAEAYNGGSMQPLVYYNCLKECTDQRTKDLKKIIKDRQNR